jgi:hypothetical protein
MPGTGSSICDNVYALIDSEREAAGSPLDPARAAFKHVCDELGIHCCILDRRATENYLTDAAVKKIKGEKHRAVGPYELLKNVPFGWTKMENWRIARETSFDDIAETDLGKFLAEL